MKIGRVMRVLLDDSFLDQIDGRPDLSLLLAAFHGALGHGVADIVYEFVPSMDLFGLSNNDGDLISQLILVCVSVGLLSDPAPLHLVNHVIGHGPVAGSVLLGLHAHSGELFHLRLEGEGQLLQVRLQGGFSSAFFV